MGWRGHASGCRAASFPALVRASDGTLGGKRDRAGATCRPPHVRSLCGGGSNQQKATRHRPRPAEAALDIAKRQPAQVELGVKCADAAGPLPDEQ